MPPRIARSSVQVAAPKTARNKNRKRNLDAYAIASHATKADQPRLNSNRIGEFLDDEPKHKRRRAVEDEEGSEEDIEEDVPAGKRRRTADEDPQASDEGSDSEGNEWRLGGMKSDDDDSELHSDEAFGESDEEKFEGFTFRGSSSGKKQKKAVKKTRPAKADEEEEMDLDEGGVEAGDEEEDDDFGDEGVDLATMLDDEDDEVMGSKGKTKRDLDDEDGSESDESGSGFSDEEEDDEDAQADEERAARMRDRLDALNASGKPTTTPSTQQPSALTVDDLLATLDPASRKQYDAALKTRKKSSRPTTLAAPLPKRQQDRLNREFASEKAKEQLDRWRDTVIQNRRAEFLSFPLRDPNASEPMGKQKFIVNSEPQNELEANIQRIMEESGLSTAHKADEEEADIIKAEDLATNNLPVEEVMRRRAELRKARELLFREEIKSKRLSKIKSKSYRRVHRKERKREQERARELLGEDEAEDEREANDRKRAMARVSTKHRDSKFAKALKETNRGVWDEGAREAVIDEARRREELQRRIRGEDIGDEEESDVPSDMEEESEDGFEGFGEDEEDAATLKQLRRINNDREPVAEKGLGGLKFMRAADERKRAQNDETVEMLRKELAVQDGDEEESDDGKIHDQGLGRAVFGPKGKEVKQKQKAKRPELEEGDESGTDGDDETEIVTENAVPADKDVGADKKTSANGTLAKAAKSDRTNVTQGATNESLVTASNKSSRRGKTARPDTTATDQSSSEKTPGNKAKTKSMPAPAPSEQPPQTTDAGNTAGWTIVNNTDQQASDSDPEPIDPIVNKSALHLRAFGAADEDKTFAAEKSALAASEDEQETSSHLPGWGSWAGAGLSKSIRRGNARAKHNPLFKTKTAGTRPEHRKDVALENVIISEKGVRKGKGYMAPILPHGFETKEQYERSLRVPVGPEWTTKEVFQRNTRPRVVVKPGSVVQPLERPLL